MADPVTQVVGRIGHMEPFDDSASDWTSYDERLTSFLHFNKVPEADKVHAFLSLIGAKTYALLKSLTAPDLPSSKSYDTLRKLLGDHLAPKPSVIGERAKFYRRSQRETESIAEFVAELRSLSSSCEFDNFLDEALRDRFVCGLRREDIQRVLFAEDKKLTFQKAVEKALAMDSATKSAAEVHGSTSVSDVNHVTAQKQGQKAIAVKDASEKKASKMCWRCGSFKHVSKNCTHASATCFGCGKKGHIQRICQSDKNAKLSHARARNMKVLDCATEVMLNGMTGSAKDAIIVRLLINKTPLEMELDTGAAVSVISRRQQQQLFPSLKLRMTNLRLRTYTGALVEPAGVAEVVVEHNGQSVLLPLYVTEQGGPPLLGREWLQHVRLDWNAVFSCNKLCSAREPTSTEAKVEVSKLLQKYSNLFKEELGCITEEKAELFLKADARPKFLKARSVPFALVPAVEKELDKMQSMGVITPLATCEYATPVVPVVKKDGNIRLCGDYKTTVNPMLDTDRYPLPRVEEIFAALSGGQEFSKIDLNRAYQQVVLAEPARRLLAINTTKGLFAVNRLPFGVSSAPGIFQRIMDTMLKDLKGVACYLDDILVTGRTRAEHLQNLEAVLTRLESRGVRLRAEKCSFFQKELTYLGHKLSADGIHPTTDKTDAIVAAPAPENKQQLRSLLGAVNYYGKFLPQLATLAHPLYKLLRDDQAWAWTSECQTAFDDIKAALASTEVLAHYDPQRPLQMACDASHYGVGAVLSHIFADGTIRPVAYASRTLSDAEQKYSQIEKEALAIIFGVKKFHYYIYGRQFTLITDHKPLQTILGSKSGIPTLAAARLQRWAVTLSAYTYSLKFRPANENLEADCLSRLPVRQESANDAEETFYSLRLQSMPVTHKDIARATSHDQLLCRVLELTSTGWPNFTDDVELKPFFDRRTQLTTHQGCLLWGMRVVVPAKLRSLVLQELHDGHPGIVRSKELARSYVWWPSIDADLESHVKACKPCQEQRSAPNSAPLHPWSWPTSPWKRVHIDFAGPFRQHMFLVVVDAHSKWPEVCIMKNTTSTATIDRLREMFSRFGYPTTIVSDNGPQFKSAEFQTFVREIGARHVTTAPYHPSSNGLAERFVQSLKTAMKKDLSTGNLQASLHSFLLAYRNTPHATTKEAPANLMFGRRLRSKLDILKPEVEELVRHQQFIQSGQCSSKARQFAVGDCVLVRNYRGPPRWLPGTVVRQKGPVSYAVKVHTPRGLAVWHRHQDQLLLGAADVSKGEENKDTFWEFSDTTAETPTAAPAASEAALPVRRYPVRNRRAPDRYTPS